jgi:serine/threonine-protein kinase
MGSVWSAAFRGARGFRKLVAIKTILHELADEVQYARALRDEAHLASSISHPQLCEVTELSECDGYPYLVMEWIDGASLAELLDYDPATGKCSPLDPELAARVAADACAGLHALHEARDHAGVPLGAVHRDVSPHNVMLTRDAEVKVSDLGVAKARGQWRARTRSGELRGKLGFLAPEQLRGESVDRRTDVHAVGCVLYLCITGQLPYPASMRSFELVLEGSYAPIESLLPTVPPDLTPIVARALRSNPDERFQSAHALRAALEAWLAGHSARATASLSRCLYQRVGDLIERRNRRIQEAFDRFVRSAGRDGT